MANAKQDNEALASVKYIQFGALSTMLVLMGSLLCSSIANLPAEIRRARLQFKKGQLSEEEYEKHVNEYMEYAIREQEAIDMDVLVHGEPERTDMVEYFGMKVRYLPSALDQSKFAPSN